MDPSKRCPVVIFVAGGAWTIGYKAWGALMGKLLIDEGKEEREKERGREEGREERDINDWMIE